jgi:hypothetical protein
LKIEWISDTGGNNWHRNVIFHENGAREFDIRRTAEYVLPVPRGKGKYMDQTGYGPRGYASPHPQ